MRHLLRTRVYVQLFNHREKKDHQTDNNQTKYLSLITLKSFVTLLLIKTETFQLTKRKTFVSRLMLRS